MNSRQRIAIINQNSPAFRGLCIASERRPAAEESGTPFRKVLHEDWTESAWFKEWLALARNNNTALP
jgi:hypothetical protein